MEDIATQSHTPHALGIKPVYRFGAHILFMILGKDVRSTRGLR
jgi:hypothetical protein